MNHVWISKMMKANTDLQCVTTYVRKIDDFDVLQRLHCRSIVLLNIASPITTYSSLWSTL